MAARPAELVLDPFRGSGTTALACLATGRQFLGCDIDPGAVSLALERIGAYERGDIDIGTSAAETVGCEAIDEETGA
jgi:DNA modification methylase